MYDKHECQGHGVKNAGTDKEVLPQGIHMCNIESLFLLNENICPRLKFFQKYVKHQCQGHRVLIF